jgi:hypothetical protein
VSYIPNYVKQPILFTFPLQIKKPLLNKYFLPGMGMSHSLSWHRKGNERTSNGRYFARVWTPEADPRHRNTSGTSNYINGGL